jgi:hypothetical protein
MAGLVVVYEKSAGELFKPFLKINMDIPVFFSSAPYLD